MIRKQMIRKGSLLVLGRLLIAGISTLAPAQDDGIPPSSAGGAPIARSHRDPARELAQLTRKLNLTPEQQSEVKGVLQTRQQQMQSLAEDQTLNRVERISRERSIMDDSKNKIEAVLDDSQRQKFEKVDQAMRNRRHSERNGSQDSGPDGPPPDDMGPPPDGPPPDGGGPPPGQ